MVFDAKGIFLWNTPAVLRGDPAQIAASLVAAGFEAAYLHTNDGVAIPSWDYKNSPYPGAGENVKEDLVEALRGAGLRVFGWGAVYGKSPIREAEQAARQCARFGLDGYVFDAEGAWENQVKAVGNTLALLGEFRRSVDTPVAWCSFPLFRSPDTGGRWHDWTILDTAMAIADAGMPMAYWWHESPARAEWMLINATDQWRQYCHNKPIIPACRAYNGDGGVVREDAVLYAADWVADRLGGITWWSMDHALKLPKIWQALTETPKMAKPPTPPEPGLTLEQRLDRLYDEARRRGWQV